jgi:molybdate transport system substrate-binding protein
MNRKTLVCIAGVLLLLASACAPQTATQAPIAATEPPSVSLTVLAAASLTEPFQEIGQLFESSHPGVTVQFSFAGSQQLSQQLANGAPADVFASASNKYMDEAVTNARVASGAPALFARNRLVVITPADNPATLQTLQDLAKPGLKLVLAAQEVPVGKYSLEFLDKAQQDSAFSAGFKDLVLANVVSYEENVKSVLTKIELGEADAGIVYTSDISGEAAEKVTQIVIPDALNVLASYPIAVIQDSAHIDVAQDFVEWVLSQQGQEILVKYGFIIP